MKMKLTHITGLFGLVLFVEGSWACSCRIGDMDKRIEDHVSIFQGTVNKITPYKKTDFYGDQVIRVNFNIEKQWKGTPEQNELLTVHNGFSCYGYWFKEGQRYVIYAFEKEDTLNAWHCGGVISEDDRPLEFKAETQGLDHKLSAINSKDSGSK